MQDSNNTSTGLQFSTCPDSNKTNMTFFHLKEKKKKNKRITLKKYKSGRWDEREHALFKMAFLKHGNDWKSVESLLKRRSAEQIRSHSQKFHIKLLKKYSVFKKTNAEIKFDSEFDRKFIETFKKDERKIFHIRKIHHFHDKLECLLRKRQKKKVFNIAKEKCRTNTSLFFNVEENKIKNCQLDSPISPEMKKYLTCELQLLSDSNQRIINSFFKNNLSPEELNFTYSHLLFHLRNNPNGIVNVLDNSILLKQFFKMVNDIEALKKPI